MIESLPSGDTSSSTTVSGVFSICKTKMCNARPKWKEAERGPYNVLNECFFNFQCFLCLLSGYFSCFCAPGVATAVDSAVSSVPGLVEELITRLKLKLVQFARVTDSTCLIWEDLKQIINIK